jgi:succinate-semialdehyde dehydrogenase/glutarate-semialdehyde dehydrogenase
MSALISDATKSHLLSVNPATGETLATIEPFSEAQIEQKLLRAAGAFNEYRRMPMARRSELLLRVAQILDCENERLARLITTEMGKVLRTAREEVAKCAWACRYYAESAESLLADGHVETGGASSYVRRLPVGPVLALMTWNFPMWQVFRFAAPALMAGNVCLVKHAPNVPQCSIAVEDIFRQAGAPDGVFTSLLVHSDQVEPILRDARVKAVTFTGSVKNGRRVACVAGAAGKKVVLELGGNDAFIVMPSANLEQAVAAAVEARVVNSGQSCSAAKRFVVARQVADDFEHRFVQMMKSIRVGDPTDESSDIGPLATAGTLDTLERQVEQSLAAGCCLLLGGKRLSPPGNYFSPTVLTDIKEGSPAHWEELYGPVASLFRVGDIEEAIRVANDSNFGLGASAWTNDVAERAHFIESLQAGMVFINRRVRSDPRLPFGGIKDSGFGRELGADGLLEFTVAQTVWVQGGGE